MIISSYTYCSCGAITVYDENGMSYSCKKENFNKFFPDVDLSEIEQLQTSYCCDHCVNHYGLDLCGCGSGEDFGHCDNNLPECEIPMQKIDQYSRVIAKDALIS